MKLKVITKLLIGGSLAIVAIAPTLTLSSCASISQWSLPINIGGSDDKNPWSKLNDLNSKNDLNDHYNIEDYGYYSPNSSFAYLPSSFISYTDRSASTDNYEYATIYDDKNWKTSNQPSYFDPKWVDYTDTNLQKMSESYDVGSDSNKKTVNVFTSIQNANIYNSLSFNSIALGINLFISGFLRLMTQDGVMNTQSNKDWYDALFGNLDGTQTTVGLNRGEKSSDENKRFYEFLFDLLDTLSQGKFAGKFGLSAIDYKFASEIYGPGPFIRWENEAYSSNANDKLKQFVGWNDSENQFSFNENDISENVGSDNKKVVDKEKNSLSSNFILNANNPIAEIEGVPSARAAYTAFATSGTDKTTISNNKFYPSVITTQIPFVISPANFTYSYYNPLTKHSFQQNDYLLDDINPIKKQVANTNAWNNFSKHVDTSTKWKDKKSWVDSLSFDLNNDLNKETNSTFYPSAVVDGGNVLFKELNDKYDNVANYVDPTTFNILSNNFLNDDTLQPNSYICFANYAFALFPQKNLDTDNNIVYEPMPIFAGIAQNSSGVPAVFPISLLYQSNDVSVDALPTQPKDFDLDLWAHGMMPEANVLYNYKQTDNNHAPWHDDNFKNNPENNIYYLDLNKLYDKQTNIYNFFNTNIDLKKTPRDYFNSNKDVFQTIWDLLGTWNFDKNWSMKATDSSILLPES